MRTKALLIGGALAGPAFMTTLLAEGARRPDFSPMRHPGSSLALGPDGWRQKANFLVAGSLYIGLAAGLARQRRSRAEVVAPALTGAGLLISGVFTTDPVGGYPPGTPPSPEPITAEGRLHDLGAVPVFLGLPIVMVATSVRAARSGETNWAALSAGLAVTMLATFVPATLGFAQQEPFERYGGAFQRASIASGLGWLTALALRALR